VLAYRPICHRGLCLFRGTPSPGVWVCLHRFGGRL